MLLCFQQLTVSVYLLHATGDTGWYHCVRGVWVHCQWLHCHIYILNWESKQRSWVGPGRRDKRKKKSSFVIQSIKTHAKIFRINLKLLTFLFAPSFPVLPGVWVTGHVPHFEVLSLPNFAKRDKGMQTHTFLLTLSKAHIIFRTRSSWMYSSRQPLPKSYF